MITRIALNAQALNATSGSSLDQRIQSQRLAQTIWDYGLLAVAGKRDASELQTQLARLTEAVGYDFWRPLVSALADSGQGVFRASAEDDATIRELCEAGNLEPLRALANLVVVAGDSAGVPGLSMEIAAKLYETHGFADAGDGLELALAIAADQSSAVGSVKRLRGETIIPKGIGDGDLWADYFSGLAQVSSEVNVFDRYLFSGLVLTSSRLRPDVRYLLWFLNQLDRVLPTSATINLFAWTGEKMAKTNRDRAAKPYTTADLSSAFASLEKWDRPDRLHIYLWDGLHHDRHLRFSSGHAIMPQQGLDQLKFHNNRLTRNFSYSFVPTGPSLSARAAEEAGARARGQHWVLRTRTAGLVAR